MEQNVLDLTKNEIESLCDQVTAPGRPFSAQLMDEAEPECVASSISVSITWTR